MLITDLRVLRNVTTLFTVYPFFFDFQPSWDCLDVQPKQNGPSCLFYPLIRENNYMFSQASNPEGEVKVE